MESIQLNSVLTFVSYFAILMMVLCVGVWFVWTIGKRSDYPCYLDRITYLERLIDKCNVDIDSFDYILQEFDVINQFRKKDLRRNQEAFVKFSFKFKDEWKKRIEEND